MPAGTGKRGSERDLEEVVGVRGCQRHKAEVMAAGALCRRERRIDAAAGVGSRSSERAGESSRLGLPEAEAEAPRRRNTPRPLFLNLSVLKMIYENSGLLDLAGRPGEMCPALRY